MIQMNFEREIKKIEFGAAPANMKLEKRLEAYEL